MRRFRSATAAMVLASCLPWRAQAEAPIADRYTRAGKLMFVAVQSAMKNMTVVPHWIGKDDRFWYQRQTATGSEFIIVDAATGAKHPAFDAGGVAAALTPILGSPVVADALPFATFDYSADGMSILFEAGGKKIGCIVATSTCAATGAGNPGREFIVSPDGKLAVTSRDGNLWLRDLATDQERALTSDGAALKGWGVAPDPNDFQTLRRQQTGMRRAPFWTIWSPDSKRLITSFLDQSAVPPYPYLEYAPGDGSLRPRVHELHMTLVGEIPSITKFFAIDVATGSRQRLDLDSHRIDVMEMGASLGRWAEDNRHYRLFAPSSDVTAQLMLDIDTATGVVREIVREKAVYPALLAAGGYSAAMVAPIDGGRRAIWPSQRSGWTHLSVYDTATGKELKKLTQGAWIVRDLIHVDEANRRVYFVGAGREGGNPYYRSLYSIGLDGRDLRLLTPEAGDKPLVNPRTTRGFDGTPGYDPVSPSGRYIVYGVSSVSTPTVTILRPTEGKGEAHVIERGDAAELFAAGYRPPEEFTVKAADGKSNLYGVVYRPSDYDATRKYPVIVAQYNSPGTTIVPRNFAAAAGVVIDNSGPPAETQLGFIVVMVDARGTPFRGAAFSNPPPGYIADMGLVDHVATLKQLAARDPSMDMARVGIVGASFGGWTVIRALTNHNDVFKAGVAWAPPGAFHNMYIARPLTGSLGEPTYVGGALLRPKAADAPDNWQAANAIADVGKMKGRLLFGTGGLDENVPPGTQLQFIDAAAKAGKDVEQIFLPNATHGPMPYWPYVVKRTWDFLVRTLRDETPPTDWTFPEGAFPPS